LYESAPGAGPPDEDLEPVADPDDQASRVDEPGEAADRGFLAGEHPRPPIVTERESAGEPGEGDVVGELPAGRMQERVEPGGTERLQEIAVPIGTGKDDDGGPRVAHATSPTDTE
jgi:hypothetical protein